MKHKCLHIINIAFGIATVLFLGGCSSDDSTQEPVEVPMREIHFMLGSHNYTDVTSDVSRRALPDGYVVYDNLSPQIPADEAGIKCFLTRANETIFNGTLTYKSGAWTSKIPADEGTYYVYGMMPNSEASKVTLTPRSGADFANGAVMEIDKLNAVTASDVCAIVGVKGAASKVGIENSGIELGKFSFNAVDGTFIYLLIDHLYAALQLNMNINSDYNALRTIKLTKLTLKSNSVTKTYKVTATMTPNETNTSPLAVTYVATTEDGKEIELYNGKGKGENGEDIEKELEVDKYIQFLACTVPLSTNTQFEMETTYNVYDRKGNLIRKNCTAKNVLNLPTGGLARGQKYTFNLTVNPTYLYVLSDPDLDNPTVVVN
jgi:hypothetical protein